jgi:flagellar hook-basal body complex protein FliE
MFCKGSFSETLKNATQPITMRQTAAQHKVGMFPYG